MGEMKEIVSLQKIELLGQVFNLKRFFPFISVHARTNVDKQVQDKKDKPIPWQEPHISLESQVG